MLDNERKNSLFNTLHKKYGRCLFPGASPCQGKVIKAHSIQNNGVLNDLVEDGHVAMITHEMNAESGPKLLFKKVGRNKASTFMGLCSEHDNLTFQPIDDFALDTSNPEHLFLLAFRSALRELNSKADATAVAANRYRDLVDLGHIDASSPSPAHESVAVAFEFYAATLHIAEYGEAHRKQVWEDVQHTVIKIPGPTASFACSGAYSLQDQIPKINGKPDIAMAALNVFPDGEYTVVVVSHLSRHEDIWSSHIHELKSLSGEYQKYYFSKLLLTHCENLILKPSFVNGFSEEKTSSILRFFEANFMAQKVDKDDELLFLF